jgi:hypothetical protein
MHLFSMSIMMIWRDVVMKINEKRLKNSSKAIRKTAEDNGLKIRKKSLSKKEHQP